jgi:hypothetical protein
MRAADEYLSSVSARVYYDPRLFEAAGIEALWQQFRHPAYPQSDKDFILYRNSIDLLFNCGTAESR